MSAGRVAMYNENALKLGLFGANCSSGRYVTKVPERWSGSWDDNARLAQMADRAGIDFLLPIGRWKGYGGDTDYQGATWETLTWATALLAQTERITVFGTVHAPLFHPVIAAKQMVTADHVGHGRFGLNVVCGWNEGEFDMFGAGHREQSQRYEQGQEWLDVLQMIWERDDFDFAGRYFTMKGVREKPKPYGGTRPLIMNAGSSPDGRAFALRNCDAFFTSVRLPDLGPSNMAIARRAVLSAKDEAAALGRDIDVYTVGVVVCRQTRREAADYHRYCTEENADWAAVDNMIRMRGLKADSPEEAAALRRHHANGHAGVPFIGDPDDIAERLAAFSAVGFSGLALSFVNYADELPLFRDEVLPRLARAGLRAAPPP
jgi:FMNH2-dependent dimethyl sulfone monooxygenase